LLGVVFLTSQKPVEIVKMSYVVLYDLAVEESSMRLPPGAVTKRIYGSGIAADDLNETTEADLGIATGFSPGAVTKRICGSGMAAGCLGGEIEVALDIDADRATGTATGLPHMMQVSAPCKRRPPHLTQCFAIEITHYYF
jgi:hypothetical protein